jgi:phosphinothricin tripeptide acetyl hydrolase
MAPTDVSGLVAALERQLPAVTTPVADLRSASETAAARYPMPDGVHVTSTLVGGRPTEVLEPSACVAGRTVLYLHGGGFMIGSPATVRTLAARVATAARAKAVTIDYRLAPEQPCPAATADVVRAYQDLVDQGHDPTRMAIAGDSAGGGLVVGALVAIRERGLPLPAAAVCLSPWVDLTLTSPSVHSSPGDPECQPAFLAMMAASYLAGQPADTPRASPLYADLAGLPPFLIQVGEAETLLDDSVRLAARLTAAGVPVVLERWEAMIHVWHRFAPRLPEAMEAIDRIGAWLNERLPAAHRSMSMHANHQVQAWEIQS